MAGFEIEERAKVTVLTRPTGASGACVRSRQAGAADWIPRAAPPSSSSRCASMEILSSSIAAHASLSQLWHTFRHTAAKSK